MQRLQQYSAGLSIALSLLFPVMAVAAEPSPERGAYIYRLAGCDSCHTRSDQGRPLAGGLKMETPFGIFYTPNISPDPVYGIGGWTGQQFLRAMKQGVSPDGEHYYPAFPYTSYTRMSDRDLLDLKAWLDSQPPVAQPSKGHQLEFPFSWRSGLGLWKWFNFEPETFRPDSRRSALWNRGAYIVRGPGHCGECHTPRNLLGGLIDDSDLGGNRQGPEGEQVPALRGVDSSDFQRWQPADIVFSLEAGMKPDGDFFSGSMGHVIENSTSGLREEDLRAIAEYLSNP